MMNAVWLCVDKNYLQLVGIRMETLWLCSNIPCLNKKFEYFNAGADYSWQIYVHITLSQCRYISLANHKKVAHNSSFAHILRTRQRTPQINVYLLIFAENNLFKACLFASCDSEISNCSYWMVIGLHVLWVRYFEFRGFWRSCLRGYGKVRLSIVICYR